MILHYKRTEMPLHSSIEIVLLIFLFVCGGISRNIARAAFNRDYDNNQPVSIELKRNENHPDKNKGWKDYMSFRVGIKGNLTTGYAARNFYYAPFGTMTATFPYCRISTGYTWFGNYQIYDSYGDARTIGFHEPEAAIHLVLKEVIPFIGYFDFNVGYRLGISPRFQFRSNTLMAGFNFEIHKLFIEFSYIWSETRYKYIFNPNVILYPSSFLAEIHTYLPLLQFLYFKNEKNQFRIMTFLAGVGYSITKRFSLDTGYTHIKDINNQSAKYTVYDQDHFRVGSIIEIVPELSLGCGFNTGFDSMKYLITAFDTGFMLKLFSYFKVESIYRMDYHISPAKKRYYALELIYMSMITDPSLLKAMQWFYADNYYASKTRQKRAVLGSSFISHEFSFRVSFAY